MEHVSAFVAFVDEKEDGASAGGVQVHRRISQGYPQQSAVGIDVYASGEVTSSAVQKRLLEGEGTEFGHPRSRDAAWSSVLKISQK